MRVPHELPPLEEVVMFRFNRAAMVAPLFHKQGGTWDPQGHFVGASADPFELRAA